MDPQQRLHDIKRVVNLPTLPTVFQKILAALDNPHSSAQSLKDAIVHDQSLAAKVVSVSNSAYYRGRKDIVDIAEAIVVLGLDTVKSIAMSVSIFRAFSSSGEGREFDRNGLWLHSIGCAAAAELIAQRVRFERGQAYLFGLLHDIGKVILDSCYPDEYQNVCLDARLHETDMATAEWKLLGLHHGQVGQTLGIRWQFPSQLQDALLYHHAPQDAPPQTQVPAAIAHVANWLTHRCRIGHSGTIQPGPCEPQALAWLQLAEADLRKLETELQDRMPQIASLLPADNRN